MEQETGIEPATNSLEGCDSTTELLLHLTYWRTLSIVAPSRNIISADFFGSTFLLTWKDENLIPLLKMVGVEGVEPS